MFTMHNRDTDPRGVIGSVIAVFILLACLVLADRVFWPSDPADPSVHVAKAR